MFWGKFGEKGYLPQIIQTLKLRNSENSCFQKCWSNTSFNYSFSFEYSLDTILIHKVERNCTRTCDSCHRVQMVDLSMPLLYDKYDKKCTLVEKITKSVTWRHFEMSLVMHVLAFCFFFSGCFNICVHMNVNVYFILQFRSTQHIFFHVMSRFSDGRG